MSNDKDILVKVENLSKKFCKDLKTSLWYGVKDLASGIVGNKNERELRPKEFWALKDISFQLRRGECLGLIGHNGAGKSTLLKVLNGLINPDAGKASIKGRVGALIELGAGFNPILSGKENIYNNGAILGFSKTEIDEKLEDIISFAELEEFIDMPVQHYSSGMKVRLGFAVAAQMEPDVFLIDEVLAVGDLGFVLKCFKTIDKILPHTAVIFVSHNMPMVARICTHILLMEKGKVISEGEDVAGAIDKYYTRFSQNEANLIFTDDRMELLEAEVLDQLGNNSLLPQVAWDGELKLRLWFKVHQKDFQPVFAISIFDKEQRPVAILERNTAVLEWTEGGYLELIISHAHLMLSKGIYSMNLGVVDSSSGSPLLRMNNIVNFQVIHDQEIWQPFLLKAKYDATSGL